MDPLHRIRTTFVAIAVILCATAPVGVFVHAGSSLMAAIAVGCSALLLSALVIAHLAATLRRSRDERDELHRRLAHEAHHDQLTGLPNRTHFHERLIALTARREPHALLMVDLDDFKLVNDTYGQAQGDHVLQTVAGRLDDCLRGSDLVARFGGDEFAVLVEYCPEPAVAEGLAARIIDNVRRPIDVGGTVVRIGASVGVAFDAPDAERAISLADAAMYETKARP